MLTIRLNHLLYKTALVLAVLFLSGFVLATSFRKSGGKSQIWIEAEDAESVHAPLHVIEMKDASQGKGIIAIGNHFITEGYAKYHFTVPEDGEYVLWARCYWLTLCTNSFSVSCDNSFPEVLGEDPVTNQWHWVLGCRFKLKRGRHEMIIWNREQSSQVDKFLITSDASYTPAGMGTSNFITEDFEENAIPANFNFAHKDRWAITDDRELQNKSLFLKAGSGGENDKSMIRVENPENYTYRVAYRSPDPDRGNVLIDFSYANEGNYYYASLQGRSIDIYSVKNGVATIIGHKEYKAPVLRSEFQYFSIEREDGIFRIRNNGTLLYTISTPPSAGMGVGIGSSTGNVYFDNIVTSCIGKLDYTENFHATEFHALKDMVEVDPHYLDHMKKGYNNWWAAKGTWIDPFSDGFEVIKGKCAPGNNALVVFGDDDWKNYNLQVAVRTSDESGIGILFNYQDSANYAMFKWKKDGARWLHQVVIATEGRERIVSEKPAIPLKKGNLNWYKLNVKTRGDSLKVYLDDKPIFSTADSGFKGEGKTGFWTTSVSGADFDDIRVTSIEDLREASPPGRLEYDLYWPQKPIATSYADWVPSSDSAFNIYDSSLNDRLYLSKPLFEGTFIRNKNIFPGTLRIETNTNALPRDVEACYELYTYSKGVKTLYQVIIGSNKTRILKDSREVFGRELPSTGRAVIAVWKTPLDWQIKVDSTTVKWPDKTAIDSVRLGIGYTGMGMGSVEIYGINIDKAPNRNEK